MVRETLLLTCRFIWFYRGRTTILCSAIALTVFLPLATRWMTQRFEEYAMARARATPLLFGKKGSRFGLALHGLYFRGESPAQINWSEVTRIDELKLAKTIPIFAKFRARGYSIVGTTRDYLAHRRLELADGEPWERLGDCLLGAKVTRELGLKPGDKILSEPENLFDLSGPSPFNMRITGTLAPTGTADDEVVFCDLKTAWIIQGIGHGHQLKASESGDTDVNHSHSAGRENLSQYNTVTNENIKSFHFHGRRETYPLTTILAIPDSEKSEAILMGKYLSPDEMHQIIRPTDVVAEILEVVGRVRRLFDIGVMFLAVATILLVVLVLLLSLRLRQREMRTMFLLGCSRGTIARVIATELFLVLLLGCSLAVCLAWIATQFSDSLITRLL